MRTLAFAIVFSALHGLSSASTLGGDFQPLFPDDRLEGWNYSDWSNLTTPQKIEGTPWKMEGGVLSGLGKRTWIFSPREYGDFTLKFDWKLTPGANGGVGLRFPPDGDPAFRGMEIQIVDFDRYYRGKGDPLQGTGAIYNGVAPKDPKVKPAGEWNSYEITCRGSQVTLLLNGQEIIDADLAKETALKAEVPAGTKPLAERPLKGRIGFQNLSGSIDIRQPMIKLLD